MLSDYRSKDHDSRKVKLESFKPANEEIKEEPNNLSDVETPRMDVTGLKLESAQKEKTSFL